YCSLQEVNSTCKPDMAEETAVTQPMEQSQPAQLPREALISTAIHFLENPRVQASPLSQKRAFLLKKGLTNDEIDSAIERARTVPVSNATDLGGAPGPYPPPLPPPVPMGMLPHALQPPELSMWTYMRHISSSVVLIGVACYGAYYLYKRFFEPYLRGQELSKEQNRLVQVQEQVDALTSAIGQLREAIASLESTVGDDRRNRGRVETLDASKQDSALSDLKSEVLSVKALLLSRNQFPSTPKVTPLAVSIPAWQLSAGGDSKKEENGTASGDSEEEHETDEQKSEEATSNGQVAGSVAAALV
ncbi:unnamed protein product, partial [Ixodes hexagonus]